MKAAEAADWQAYSSVTWWAVACAWTGVHSSTALRGAIPLGPVPAQPQPADLRFGDSSATHEHNLQRAPPAATYRV